LIFITLFVTARLSLWPSSLTCSARRNYLAFELKKGDHARICLLFERCLIACANYPEFWKRYMDYLERIGEVP
jgi:hypothetical protein